MTGPAWKLLEAPLKAWQAGLLQRHSVHALWVSEGKEQSHFKGTRILGSSRFFSHLADKVYDYYANRWVQDITFLGSQRGGHFFPRTLSGGNVKNSRSCQDNGSSWAQIFWVFETIGMIYWTFHFPQTCLLGVVQMQISQPGTMSVERRIQSPPNPTQLVFQQQTTLTVAIFIAGKILDGCVVSSFTRFHFTREMFGIRLVFFKTMVQINLYWRFKREREIATFKWSWPQVLWYLRHIFLFPGLQPFSSV